MNLAGWANWRHAYLPETHGESGAAIWTSRTRSQLAPGAAPPMRCRARIYLRGSVSPVLPVSPAGVKAQMDAPQSRSAWGGHWCGHSASWGRLPGDVRFSGVGCRCTGVAHLPLNLLPLSRRGVAPITASRCAPRQLEVGFPQLLAGAVQSWEQRTGG